MGEAHRRLLLLHGPTRAAQHLATSHFAAPNNELYKLTSALIVASSRPLVNFPWTTRLVVPLSLSNKGLALPRSTPLPPPAQDKLPGHVIDKHPGLAPPPPAPSILSFSPDTAPTNDGHTTATTITLSGTGLANTSINVFDGSTLI